MGKIGSPLYILRNECEKDLMAVIERLAEIGFGGIEFFGFFGNKPEDIKRKLDSCGIEAIGDHVPVPFDDFAKNIERIIEEHCEIGCGHITTGVSESEYCSGEIKYRKT